jgi:hypothetical protein
VNEKLHERFRRVHECLLICAWEYRQRSSSKGVWYRFEWVLVDAAEALEACGHIPHHVGLELAPPKRLFLLAKGALETVPHRRQVPVRLHSELLPARSLAFLQHMRA